MRAWVPWVIVGPADLVGWGETRQAAALVRCCGGLARRYPRRGGGGRGGVGCGYRPLLRTRVMVSRYQWALCLGMRCSVW